MANRGMSLESMLDEERRDVLALLEGPPKMVRQKSATLSATGRSASPLNKPQSPVRSMLDIDDDFVAWHSALTSNNGAATSPRTLLPVRSMLDFGGAPPASPPIRSMLDISVTPSSTAPPAAEHNQKAKVTQGTHPRSYSDAATRPASFGPRSNTGVDVEAAYQFTGFLPSNPGNPFSKRPMQGGKRSPFPSAMSEVVRGGDLGGMFGRDRGRNSMPTTPIGSFSGAKSRSPHNRMGLRSNSPQVSPDFSKFRLDDGREIYSHSAYKMLSDDNLATSAGSLSSLGKASGRRRTLSGTTTLPDGSSSRLEKDDPVDGEDVVDDSSDERQQSSDEERPRGRKMHVVDLKTGMYPDGEGYLPNTGPRKDKTALSLLAAAEEERK